MSPIVIVPKKNGKLRVCVNLKKVNAATIRDHYPLPIIDHVLEWVAGKQAYSFLDGFLGYNQVSIKQEDQHKTTFATEWGIYAYRVMIFGLTNAPATFQMMMNNIFVNLISEGKVCMYIDDILIFTADLEEHRQIVQKVPE